MPVTDTEVRDFAAALRACLYPPDPATLEGWARHDRMLCNRAAYIAGIVRGVAEGRSAGLADETGVLRELAAGPLPYKVAAPETPAECDQVMIAAALRKSVLLGETSQPVPGTLAGTRDWPTPAPTADTTAAALAAHAPEGAQ